MRVRSVIAKATARAAGSGRCAVVSLAIVLAVLSGRALPLAARQVTPMCAGCPGVVDVTPVNFQEGRPMNGGPFTAKFTIGNAEQWDVGVFNMTCSKTGAITCGTITPTSLSIPSWANDTVEVQYTTQGLTSGTLTLTVSHDGVSASPRSGTMTIMGPPNLALILPILSSGSRAVVASRQPIIRALFTSPYPVDTTQTVLKWRGEVVTAKARHGRGLIEWEVDSTRWLGVGDSALVEVTACATGSGCRTVTRWAVLPNDTKPILGFTAIPLGAHAGGFSAPFGPGLSVAGAELQTGLSIPGYQSMGAGRTTGLAYSTRQSYPRAVVPVDLELTWPAGLPTQVKLRLWDGVTKLDSIVLASPSCATGATRRCRAVLQADFAGATFPTPTRKYLKVEALVTSGATTVSNTDSVEIVLVDRRTTPYGSGWWPAGVSQLVAAGADRLLIDPTGTVMIYRGNGDTSYIPPPGVFGSLTKVGTSRELNSRGSAAKTVFNNVGRLVARIDQNGNTDSVRYDGAGRIAAIRDPVGKVVTLAYNGSGKLLSFTDPGGRVSVVSINGTTHQLTYDSLSSPTTRPMTTVYVYQTYPGTGTVVLTKEIGVLSDTTVVTYDSAFRRRPIQVALPLVRHPTTGGWVAPIVEYTAMERRGVGTLVPLDSAYVMLIDPRGFWTKSLVNRWGQSIRTWDQLGLLARSAYDPDGLVLWSQGKTGDSSRTYSVYNAARLPVKTYVVRAVGDTLRSDSVVYDGSHRVIQVIDNRGKSRLITYDGAGNRLVVKDPNGDSTRTWYRSDGLVDSVKLPGPVLAIHRYKYESVWKQIAIVVDPSEDTTSWIWYDTLGRLDSMRSKLQGDSVGGYQWSKVTHRYNSAGQRDSTIAFRAPGVGAAPPTAWPASTDHLGTTRTAWIYDRGGRDSLRINNRGKASRTEYDRLGRLTRRWPWSDSTAVRDSIVYDLAGNVVVLSTRRGHVITANYDGRNRDTLRVIPTIGTELKTYGGPLDQLTTWSVTGYVDSIGGLNPQRTFSYDQRGRLLNEASYPLGSARTTTMTYDGYERVSSLTDALGAWVIGYEANRGHVTSVTTPLGDVLNYRWNGRGRADSLAITMSGSTEVSVRMTWNLSDALTMRRTSSGSGQVLGKWTRIEPADGGPAVVSRWHNWYGGAAMDSTSYWLAYDGWRRLSGWEQLHKAPWLDQLFQFDAGGNVTDDATYDATTERLATFASSGTWTYGYDRAGNTTSATDGTTTWAYGYDALNRLVSARRNGTLISRYAYDVTGQRMAKQVYSSVSGGTVGFTAFVYRGSRLSYEMNASSTITWKYVWGLGTDDLVAFRDAAGSHYYAITDELGSVRNVKKRGAGWTMALRYQAYGALVDSAGPGVALRYRWTGREWDAETGMYHLRARTYNPTTRRFLQEDPTGYVGGDNLYAYVDGSPLERTDPSGLAPDPSRWRTGPNICARRCGARTQYYLDGVPVTANLAVNLASSFDFTTVSTNIYDQVWKESRAGLRGSSGRSIVFNGTEEERADCRRSPACSTIWLAVDASGVRTVVGPSAQLNEIARTSPAGPHDLSYITIKYNYAYFDEFSSFWGAPVNVTMILAHELAHALYLTEVVPNSNPYDWDKSNAIGLEWENMVRAEYGYKPRPRHNR